MKNKYSVSLFVCLWGISVLFAADPRLEQGKIFLKAGEYEKALGEYTSILAENPKSAEAYFAAAEVRFQMGDFSRALANYKLAYRYEPTMSAAYEGAAKVYERLGNKQLAAAEIAKDPKNRPPEAETSETPVETHAEQQSVTTSAVSEKTAESAPVKETVKTEVKTETKVVPPPAIEPEEKVVAKPTQSVAEKGTSKTEKSGFSYDSELFQKGRALFQSKKYAEAAGIWRDILRAEPGNPGAYYFAGVGRYELGELDKAEFNLKRSFDFPELGYNAHYYLSLIYKKQKKVKAEITELKKYISKTQNVSAREQAEKRLAELENKNAAPSVEKSAEKSLTPVASANEKKESETPKVVEAVAEKTESSASKSVTPTESEKSESTSEKQTVAAAEKQEAPSPSNVEKSASSVQTIDEANELLASGNLSAALTAYKHLQETANLSEDDASFVLLQIGNIYRERRDFRMAVARYRECVETYPDALWATEAERAWKDAGWQENHADELPRKR